MLNVPHSYPYLAKEHRSSVMECFDMEYIGHDESLEKEIVNELKSYLFYDFIGTTTSASTSLLLILKYLGIKEGDEIILPAINCWSVYNVAILEKVTPVICDTRAKNDFRLNYETVEKQITPNTKAIIITHMYGVLVEESIIKKLKNSYPYIAIIEDFSTSLFSKNDYKLGKYSDFGIGSFGSTKPLTGGIGGVLCSKKKILNKMYDQKMDKFINFNVKISRLNQTLLLSQIKTFLNYQVIKKEILDLYLKYVNIYGYNNNDLFRAITFNEPKKLLNELSDKKIELDVRNSVQPNLAKELNLEKLSNAYSFMNYWSLPLNIKAHQIFTKKELL